jgi:hypothetical protein
MPSAKAYASAPLNHQADPRIEFTICAAEIRRDNPQDTARQENGGSRFAAEQGS